MQIIDFNDEQRYPLSNRDGIYGGNGGNKDGILIDGEFWFIKYPKTTRREYSNQASAYCLLANYRPCAYLANATYFTVRVVKNYWTNPKTGAKELTIYFTNLSKEFSASKIISLYEKR